MFFEVIKLRVFYNYCDEFRVLIDLISCASKFDNLLLSVCSSVIVVANAQWLYHFELFSVIVSMIHLNIFFIRIESIVAHAS